MGHEKNSARHMPSPPLTHPSSEPQVEREAPENPAKLQVRAQRQLILWVATEQGVDPVHTGPVPSLGGQGHSCLLGNILPVFAPRVSSDPVAELPNCISLTGTVTVVPAPTESQQLPWHFLHLVWLQGSKDLGWNLGMGAGK